jgi:hypothetical protein
MPYSLYIIGLAFTSLFGWASFFLVVTQLDPEEFTGILPFVAFYITLFISVTSTASILSFYIRVLLSRNRIYYNNLNISLREGFFVAFFICVVLSLQYYRVLSLWDFILLVVSLILLEIFLLSKKKDKEL